MNTFLISNDYAQCARCLDPERLQRCLTDSVQIAKLLIAYDKLRDATGRLPFGVIFPNSYKLWVSSSGRILMPELREYYNALHAEYQRISGKPHATYNNFNWASVGGMERMTPYTLSWPSSVYYSHRSRLLVKDKSFYYTVFSREKIDMSECVPTYCWEQPDIV